MTLYGAVLLAAFLLFFVSIVVIVARARKVRTAGDHSPSRGSEAAGIRYAFTLAFAPWHKESARRHLVSYMAGVVFHLAGFAMIALLAASLVNADWGAPLRTSLALLFVVGMACGLGLLLKRLAIRTMRRISVPEDYLSNLLVNLALAAGLLALLQPSFLPLFQLTGAFLLLFSPLGKLRHMVFLLSSRWHWGKYYGRRGIRPHPLRIR